ncbi:hypothetical protein E2C01_000233 [Portunus trituberculatus]|uniref:Uncharacterized protein n=1 Tax=Portunus trituberculatus TaxID=210409 RepID=A0A5B7CEL6_PORTR|nr:hypothetical protein [Portunus trituberculatus]
MHLKTHASSQLVEMNYHASEFLCPSFAILRMAVITGTGTLGFMASALSS